MIFLDSNIPMYLVGRDHPHKVTARATVSRLVVERRRLVTDAEVYQEILHRYAATGRRALIQVTFDLVDSLVDEVFAFGHADLIAAKDVLANHPALSARDALHVAAMRREGVSSILSFDADFDTVSGIQRFTSP